MTLSKIEKCARLMGWEVIGTFADGSPNVFRNGTENNSFRPLTNKADLVDLMCAVGICVDWFEEVLIAGVLESGCAAEVEIANHPNKQTALAHAVVDVACQIYGRQFGGE